MAVRSALLAIALALLLGCGSDSFIVVRVTVSCPEVACDIPAQIDALAVRVSEAGTAREIGHYDYALEPGLTFPIEIVQQPYDDTPKHLQQEVTATLRGVAQTRRVVVHPWREGEVNLVRIDATVP